MPTPEERMDDVRAVMDAAGSERVAIYGASEGGPMAALFAATYPETNDRPCALRDFRSCNHRGWVARNSCRGMEAVPLTIAPANFPDGLDIETYAPSVAGHPGDPEMVVDADADVRQPRFSPLSPDHGGRNRRAVSAYDHSGTDLGASPPVEDLVVPIAAGEYIASQIPGAKFVSLEGVDHVHRDIGPWTGAIEEFLTGTRHEKVTNRVLATVVFTDIVASTDMAVRLGDAEWSQLLNRHDLMAQRIAENTQDGWSRPLVTAYSPRSTVRPGQRDLPRSLVERPRGSDCLFEPGSTRER